MKLPTCLDVGMEGVLWATVQLAARKSERLPEVGIAKGIAGIAPTKTTSSYFITNKQCRVPDVPDVPVLKSLERCHRMPSRRHIVEQILPSTSTDNVHCSHQRKGLSKKSKRELLIKRPKLVIPLSRDRHCSSPNLAKAQGRVDI